MPLNVNIKLFMGFMGAKVLKFSYKYRSWLYSENHLSSFAQKIDLLILE